MGLSLAVSVRPPFSCNVVYHERTRPINVRVCGVMCVCVLPGLFFSFCASTSVGLVGVAMAVTPSRSPGTELTSRVTPVSSDE